MSTKKISVIQKLFGSKKLSIDDDDEALDDANVILQEFKKTSYSRRHTVDVETFRGELTDEALMAAASAKFSGGMFGGPRGSSFEDGVDKSGSSSSQQKLVGGGRNTPTKNKPTDDRKPPVVLRRSESSTETTQSSLSSSATGRIRRSGVYVTAAAAKAVGGSTSNARGSFSSGPSAAPAASAAIPAKAIRTLLGSGKPMARMGGGGSFKRRSVRKERKTGSSGPKVDTTRPLMFPTTPETILEYHKARPFLDENEEWLLVELNEYECLVDSLAIIKIIAKHSKFFEVEPDELWEEFFEFVDDVPSYDEVINFDVWQEFRDKKYTC